MFRSVSTFRRALEDESLTIGSSQNIRFVCGNVYCTCISRCKSLSQVHCDQIDTSLLHAASHDGNHEQSYNSDGNDNRESDSV